MNELVAKQKNILVVLLHAYARRASSLDQVASLVRKTWPSATILQPELPASTLSMASPDSIVTEVLAEIDRFVAGDSNKSNPLDEIVLVGHSLGALIARKIYVVACGENEDAPLEAEYRSAAAQTELAPARSWAPLVSRIVLLAGMNRGWRVSHQTNLAKAPLWMLGAVYCHIVHTFTSRWPLIFTLRKGAEFITQLRIQWLQMRRHANRTGQSGNALTVQLLGSRDDIVAPDDNVDLVSGGDFIYLDVPYSDHSNIVEMADPQHGSAREEAFRNALLDDRKTLERKAIIPADQHDIVSDERVDRVVFVMHGIRDPGYWTHKIARRVKLLGQTNDGPRKIWATETSSYGYFPILPFLLSWYRRGKVEWLMDQYTEALARYPKASFSYVGHSNGTYLVAKALELYPCCKFENIVFAGSVVRKDYEWQNLLAANKPRVQNVLNLAATSDWVVAFFPKLFQVLRIGDLGSAGHDGFEIAATTPGVAQVKFVKGGHSAAVQEHLWDIIAHFVVTGSLKEHPVSDDLDNRRDPVIEALGRFPFLVWFGILIVVVLVWLAIAALVGAMCDDPWRQGVAQGIALAIYLRLLWVVITKF